jgi:hypothetical protein
MQLGTSIDPAPGLCSYAVNAQVFGLNPSSGLVAVAPGAANGQGRASIPSSISDGASNTILVAERYGICGFYMDNTANGPGGQAWAWWGGWSWPPVVDSAVPAFAVPQYLNTSYPTSGYWLGPPYNTGYPTDSTGNAVAFLTQPVPYDASSTTTKCDVFMASSAHVGVMVVNMADGSTRTISRGISPQTWWAAITPNSKDLLGTDWSQ